MAQYDPSRVSLVQVALKSFALGVVFLASCACMLFKCTYAPLQVYCALASVYHMLEFLSTARFNPGSVDSDSFLLEDIELLLVNAAACVEYLFKSWWWHGSTEWSRWGMVLAVLGQTVRTAAMVTASKLFNHHVQRHKSADHVLVTSGIYAFCRHPSYFGFYVWFVGMQWLLRNWIVGIVGAYKLFVFFKERIAFEEQYLVSFFPEYAQYRLRTWSGIPLVS